MTKGTLIGLALFLFAGCGTVERGTIPWEENSPGNPPASTPSDADENDTRSGKESGTFVEYSMPPSVQEKQEFLELAYNDWKGTPYLLGGSGYDGIDCSAFMQVVFEDYFGMQIPRTTREQLQSGKEVKKSQVLTGDLVFFKTGRTTYHVGVMINRDKFLHASTTNGVKISGLDHPYWMETYLTTKRVF
ncbi:NlpC/P60 family protein [Gracilimonas sediminicola]|uniref:NlpC/P60 family protein n=1 Tax=Gracilimonas sediminicola TaxID=2952158 RepID=A0A9X2L4Z6_9BACT|nr:NlpC/P60 family protein [Gracilimonas sediminicola]MCP9292389.1 NlpC/P60 family protein [Gracilimonas sediminicola]